MKDTHLCKCLNCENILIDENAQVHAPVYDLKDYPQAMGMVYIRDTSDYDSESWFWACPVCENDGYLVDDIKQGL